MTVAARTMLAVEEEARRRRGEELVRVLGTTIGGALADPNVVEVMVNEDGAVWIDELVGGMHETELRMAPIEVEDVITTIASALGKSIDRRNPSLQGELPGDGSRVQAFMPPATETAPALVIRKKATRIFTLADYVAGGILAPAHCARLEAAVRERQVVLIVGGTGSGKTTLVNALLAETAQTTPRDRLVIIEDTRELQSPSRNKVHLIKSETRSYTQLLKESLRTRPDRLVFGELRDEAAFDFLMALNTGHRGSFSTIHANSARDALARLEDLVRVAGHPAVPSTIARAVDLLVFIERTGDTRRVTELASVRGLSPAGTYDLDYIEPRPHSTRTPVRYHMLRRSTLLTLIATLVALTKLPAAAATTGGASSWNFVGPITNLGLALEAIAGSIVIIALVVIIGQHLMHREDWGGMFRNVVFVLIGGAIIIAAGNFITNAGVTGSLF